MNKYSAGAIRERVELLKLEETEAGLEWVTQREVWAGVELTGKSCLFSKIGIGARAAGIVLRSRPLTLHQAIRWRGLHLFLAEITETERGWLDVQAAVVEPVRCRMRAPKEGLVFPAVVTEKYLTHSQDTPMATLAATYVLVTPKRVELTPGGLVEVGLPTGIGVDGDVPIPGDAFKVLVAHDLDPWKNEYEIMNMRDL